MHWVIDYKTWARGKPNFDCLLDRRGMQCCIGQIACQLGVPKERLLGYGGIENVAYNRGLDDIKELVSPLIVIRTNDDGSSTYGSPNNWVSDAYRINDDAEITDTEREKKLVELLAKNGHTVEFINRDNSNKETNV